MPDWPQTGRHANRALVIGAGLTALWVLMLLVFWLTSGGATTGPARWVSVVAALMPLALIWLAVSLARAIDTLREEADTLRATLERERAATDRPRNQGAFPAPSTQTARPVTQVQRAAAAAAARIPGRVQPGGSTAPGDPRQTSLGFDTPDPVELPTEVTIRALNFPDGPDDQDAIAALREALRDPDQARLIRSAQDVITLLADRGIITDDLDPETTEIAAWRRFADGQRGHAVSGVGAVRDPDMLEAATAAMRGDEVFRDAVHHFLRLFDRSVTELMPRLSDDEILWLAETRSARAFMLLARAAGLFGQQEPPVT
ncbi:hypothetical protein FQV27_13010 [Paracoccus aurantiacus]|uniref:Uncharacterized protein n=1 Tax=Paracoccus aurantiacus TaxID=2599412 RepID=A0A5C6S2E1_9RHOB|nr:hypothetical protein [Paracoccus aurantiacus]TXB68099.1 hypothetical protein FQV27_13010 [Paracoccus aurantiacus]